MKKNNRIFEFITKNSRPLSSIGYFILLMVIFFIGAPEVMSRPNLHQSVFIMLPIIVFMVVPLVFVVIPTTGEYEN